MVFFFAPIGVRLFCRPPARGVFQTIMSEISSGRRTDVNEGKRHETSSIPASRRRGACCVSACCSRDCPIISGSEMAADRKLAKVARYPLWRLRIFRQTCGRDHRQQIPNSDFRRRRSLLDAVQNGTVEMGNTALYYYFGKNPAFTFGTALSFGLNARQMISWVRHGGGEDLLKRFAQRL